MIGEVLLAVAAILYGLYFYLTKNNDYWKKKGVPYVKPEFPFGLVQDQFLGRSDSGTSMQKIYNKYKSQGMKYVGAYLLQQPTLVLFDLDLCKQVLTKDFHHFESRDFTPVTHETMSQHLFALEGKQWKDMRTKLTPTFTSGKMKNMFTLMEKCAQQLQEYIDENVLKKGGQFEVKDLVARFTTDIIATCAFGLEVNTIKDKDNEFFKVGQLIFVPKLSTIITVFMHKTFPNFSRLIRLNFFDPRVSQFLSAIVRDTVEYRKKNHVERNDFIDLLIKVKENKMHHDDDDGKSDKHPQESKSHKLASSIFQSNKNNSQQSEKEQLTLDEMTAQAFVFFAAGFETAASTTSFCLYEMAKDKQVQETLRQEIDEVLANYDGKITYQALQDMTYMDQVMNETLRLYASLPVLSRVCTEKYEIPSTGLVIDKGVRIHVPSYSIHHDPEIYPDPYKFDPSRFSEENSKGRHPYAFIPFGEGPRICIGMRFGKVQVKIGLAAILSKYELSLAPDTPAKLEIHPRIVFTTAKHPYSLIVSKRTDL